ncbi:MAG: hypothetical protein HQ464_10765 [Planctomycetes bacterium]|nr:hypothetical protein [Planctomycetota bacterium]
MDDFFHGQRGTSHLNLPRPPAGARELHNRSISSRISSSGCANPSRSMGMTCSSGKWDFKNASHKSRPPSLDPCRRRTCPQSCGLRDKSIIRTNDDKKQIAAAISPAAAVLDHPHPEDFHERDARISKGGHVGDFRDARRVPAARCVVGKLRGYAG